MEAKNERRRIPNFMVDRPALLRLSLPFIILALFSLGIVLEIRDKVLTALESTSLQGPENLPAMNALLGLQRSITMISIFGLAALAFSCLLLWLRVSHRIFGPTVQMRRHVRALIDGDYSSRIRLRKSDEFQALSSELNELAETLAKKSIP